MTLPIHRTILFLLLLLLFSTGFASPVAAIKFNGYWSYKERGGEDIEPTRQLVQRYTLGADTGLGYAIHPTSAISLSANIGYTIEQNNRLINLTETGGERQTVTEHVLQPSFRAGLFNDIFNATISATSEIRRIENDTESRPYWIAILASSWDIPLLPDLRVIQSEVSAPSSDISVFTTEGRKTNSNRFELDWDLILAKLSYDFARTTTEDTGRGASSQADSHLVKFLTFGSLLKSKLRYSLSHEYRQISSEFVTETESDSDSFLFPIEGQTLSGLTDPLILPDSGLDGFWSDVEVALNFNSSLRDSNYETTAFTLETGDRGHFAMNLQFFEQVDILRLTLDPFSTLTEEQAALLQWDFYIRNIADTGWELVTENIPASYNVIEKRFELTIDSIEARIMVAAVNESGQPLEFTELEAFALQSSTTRENSRKNHTTNFSISYKIFESLLFSNSLNLEDFENISDTSVSERNRRIFSSTLNWRPTPNLQPTFRFSESLEEQTAVADRIYRTYSFGLPTRYRSVKTSFNFSHTDQFAGDLKIYSGDQFSLRSVLPVYPDLDASWYLNYLDAESQLEEDSPSLSRSEISSTLQFSAQFHRYLYGQFNTIYNNSKTDTGSNQTASTALSMRYRPSDIMGIYGDISRNFLDSDSSAAYGLNLEYNIVRTPISRVTLRYSFSQSNSTSHGFTLKGNWSFSKYFYFTFNGSYLVSDTSTYGLFTRLSFRL